MLTAEDHDHYRHQGWVRIRSPFGPAVLRALQEELTALCRGARGPIHGGAPLRGDEDEAEVLGRHVALHFPHVVSARVREHVHHPWISAVFAAVLGPDVKLVQSMFFIRPPGGPGQAWHQDARYVPAPPGQLAGLWLALEPATVENGCLWVVPGSHEEGQLREHGPHGDHRYDIVDGAVLGDDDQTPIPVPCAAGEALLFDGHLLHSAPNNASLSFRRALALHAVPAGLRMPWMGAETSASGDCRDFELLCGVDPRAEEPKEQRLVPWLRPARF